MAEHHVARCREVIVNLQPDPGPDEQPRQQYLAPLKRLAPQILNWCRPPPAKSGCVSRLMLG
jgi:hypothetical protein